MSAPTFDIAKEPSPPVNATVRAILDAAKLPYLEAADSPTMKLTLAEAAEEVVGAGRRPRWDVACRAAGACLEHPSVPIIAVLGELNAGKSSVVAAFLSSEGRRRLPRGEGEASGTHRFVYWVPQQWLADEGRKTALVDWLIVAHGPSHEELSHDPATSAVQYRSGREHPERIGVPLVAGDTALDELGAALLDCPDVQTRDFSDANRTAAENSARMQFVVSAARLCAAFCVIWRRSQIRDHLFRTLLGAIRDTMRQTRLCLLLNMIKPESGQPGKTRRDPDVEQALSDFGIAGSDVYGAFDYDHEDWRSLTASALVDRFDDAAADDPAFRFPQFFQLSSDDSSNDPAAVGDDRFLANLPSRLNPTGLQERLLRERVVELRSKGRETCLEIDAALDRRCKSTREAYEGLFERCHAEFIDEKGASKQIASPEFNKELEKSFFRTMPVMARIPLWTRHIANSARLKGAEFVSRILPFAEARRLSNWIAQRNERQAGGFDFVDPERLAEQMLTSRWLPPEIQQSEIVAAWQAVVKRLTTWSPPVDGKALDAMTGKLWQEIADQQSRRRLVGAIFSLLTLFGIMLAVVDGGASAMVSYSSGEHRRCEIVWYGGYRWIVVRYGGICVCRHATRRNEAQHAAISQRDAPLGVRRFRPAARSRRANALGSLQRGRLRRVLLATRR